MLLPQVRFSENLCWTVQLAGSAVIADRTDILAPAATQDTHQYSPECGAGAEPDP